MEHSAVTILLVDDDPSLLGVLEAGLRLQKDYVITPAVNAAEAVHQLERHDFDLVITDYSLDDPAINGLELLRIVREHNNRTLVIIITAFASLEITLESIHLGAYDFLTKPFQLDELQLVVRNAADHVRLERENERLRLQVVDLIKALNEIEQQHGELLDRIRQMDTEGGAAEMPTTSAPASFNTTSAQEIRRRRVREQLSVYMRMSETIRDQLARERQKIEGLFQKGLLPEDTYRRAMTERLKDQWDKPKQTPPTVS